MSRADRRTADLSALLYIPDEALVRSTIEGNDTDWSDTLAYVPTEWLVGSVLQSSRRESPRFRLPPSLAPRAARDDESGLARVASALFAIIGTSPASLAAATTAHIVIFAVIAPWVAGQVRTASMITWSRDHPAVAAERIVYLSPSRPVVSPIPRRPRRSRPTTLPLTPDTITVQSPQRGWSAATDSGRPPAIRTLEQAPSSPDAEVAAALRQEFRLTGDLRVEQFDASRFELLLRVLAIRPRVRLLVRGAGPRQGEERLTGLAVAGMREAETFKRLLVDAGISPERIDIEAMPERDGNRPCPEREPLCAAGRSRVQTMIAGPVPRP